VDGVAANYIAKWSGGTWSALGSGVNGEVRALAASGSDLYAGGAFTEAGGNVASNIARWDGSGWSGLGLGMGGDYPYYGRVNALAWSGTDLYAGGDFTKAGGVAANYIAKWNGSSWSALGAGVYGGWFSVEALAVSGSNVYAGGAFRNAGGIGAERIAQWDSSSWSPFGSGMNEEVLALAVSGTNLYAGGIFTMAGGKVSAYIARAYLPVFPSLSIRRTGSQVRISWPSADTAGFALEQAAALATPTSWTTNSAPVTNDGTNKSVAIPTTNRAQYFRLRRP
jgi:trimeric autotransporter adhesin